MTEVTELFPSDVGPNEQRFVVEGAGTADAASAAVTPHIARRFRMSAGTPTVFAMGKGEWMVYVHFHPEP